MTPRLILTLLVMAACSTALGYPTDDAQIPFTQGDHQLVRELLDAGEVQEQPPRPSLEQYSVDLSRAVQRWISSTLKPGPVVVRLLLEGVRWGGLVVFVVVAVLLALTIVRALRRRGRGRAAAGDGELRSRKGGDDEEVLAPTTWWQRFEAAMQGQRLDEALAALWWWLARTLAGETAEPSWTTRQLLRQTRAAHLAACCRELDRLIYGPTTATSTAIRDLADRLRQETT